MPVRPRVLSKTPTRAASEVDVLADILDTMRLDNLFYGRLELGAPWAFRMSAGESFHFYIVARGTASIEVEGGGPPVPLSAGDVALLLQGASHTLRDARGSKSKIVLEAGRCIGAHPGNEAVRRGGNGAQTSVVAGRFQFAGGLGTSLLERLPPMIHLRSNQAHPEPWLDATVQLIVAESARRSPGGTVVLSRLADVLLVHALRSQMNSGQCASEGMPALRDPQIGRALGLMHAKPGKPWTVADLASAVGLSRSGFAARFGELVGEPPLQYLARWRMTKAARQLRETTDTLGTIAQEVGYASAPAFNRAFTRWEGTGPGAYRKRRRAPRT
ncbi:MAG: Transcriptional regulator, AraC family [Myxococcaceae bacterium]|jgi:AraC-like DNA-binding protein|nr:Transcriptional regulator, AraC family [Myxococcaceae bacterium]